MDDYDLVPSGLIRLIKQGFNVGVDYAGVEIGQPTSFFVGAALNLAPSDPDREIRNLQRKIEAGADFFLTQPIYSPEVAEKFLDQYAALHGPLLHPVLAGILPLNNIRHATFLHNEVPGIEIPSAAMARLRKAEADGPQVGLEIALELVERLKTRFQGIYLIPAFGRYEIVAEIIETVK
jgi:homocysteine S-methyltransferase